MGRKQDDFTTIGQISGVGNIATQDRKRPAEGPN